MVHHSHARFWNVAKLCALLCGISCLAGCGQLNTTTNTRFNIFVRSNAVDTNSFAHNVQKSISVSCQAGEQMLGGGYLLLNNTNAADTFVVVEGSFPSALNTWTVLVRNPDNVGNDDSDVQIGVTVYCLTTPNYPLNTQISSSNGVLTQGGSQDIEARCASSGELALSGGFQTSSLPVFQQPGGAVESYYWPGLDGTGITTIAPVFPDSTHTSMGWHVHQVYTPASDLTAPQPSVETSVYVLCAQNNIVTQAAHIASAQNTPMATASCNQEEFAVGGGYSNAAVPVPNYDGIVPYVTEGASASDYGGWTINGSDLGDTFQELALCIHIPQI